MNSIHDEIIALIRSIKREINNLDEEKKRYFGEKFELELWPTIRIYFEDWHVRDESIDQLKERIKLRDSKLQDHAAALTNLYKQIRAAK